MKDVVAIVQYVNLGLFTAVAVAAVWLWWRHRERAGLWAALGFVALAAIVDLGGLLPDDPTTPGEKLALKALIAGLVLFPYFLYRFAVSFRPPGRLLSLLVSAITVVVLAWTIALPDIPGEGETWPWSFAVYVAAFTIHWTLLTVVVTYRLWTAGRSEASVPRKRMRLLAVAAAMITLALLVSVGSTSDDSPAALVSTLLSSLSALAFLVGLAPPAILRTAWRRPETTRLQGAVAELMGATTRDEVVGRVLPPMAEIVGAHGRRAAESPGRAARCLRRRHRRCPPDRRGRQPRGRGQAVDEHVHAALRRRRARTRPNPRSPDRTRSRSCATVRARARHARGARARRRDQDELRRARRTRAADSGRHGARPG